ncbi:MAG: fimbria/pilus periplasmic chaperone [Bacteriovorax sp.]|nr:fimbria/pilus periplasmic chaperone [Bacteriovorax sp.]
MSSSIGTKADEASSLYYLENDSEQPIAVQVSLARREMDLNGIETNPKINNELSVYPSQLIIPPNEKRSVKVAWVGKDKPTKELAYRLIAEQLPIDLERNKNKKASIKVLLRYVAALYVKDDVFNSDVILKNISKDNKQVSIEFENCGKKHQVLANLNLKFSDEKKKKEIIFTADELRGMTGENILAESKRVFVFPKVGKFAEINSNDKVKISFDKD